MSNKSSSSEDKFFKWFFIISGLILAGGLILLWGATGGFSDVKATAQNILNGKQSGETKKMLAKVENPFTVALIPLSSGSYAAQAAASRADKFLSEIKNFDVVSAPGNTKTDSASIARIGKELKADFVAYFDVVSETEGQFLYKLRNKADSMAVVRLSLVNVLSGAKFSFEIPSEAAFNAQKNPDYVGLDSDMLTNVFESALGDSGNIFGTYSFDGGKESSVVYKEKTKDLISPFAAGYKLKDSNAGVFEKFEDIEKLEITEKSATLYMRGGKKLKSEDSERAFRNKKPKVYNFAGNKSYDSVEGKIHKRAGIEPYSNLEIGTVRYRFDGGLKLEGSVFFDGSQLALQIGSSNDDGTGTVYFLVFYK